MQKSGDSYRTLKTNQTVYIHPSSSLFNHTPPIKTLLYYELVMTSKSYMRYIHFVLNKARQVLLTVYIDRSWRSNLRGCWRVSCLSIGVSVHPLTCSMGFSCTSLFQTGGPGTARNRRSQDAQNYWELWRESCSFMTIVLLIVLYAYILHALYDIYSAFSNCFHFHPVAFVTACRDSRTRAGTRERGEGRDAHDACEALERMSPLS